MTADFPATAKLKVEINDALIKLTFNDPDRLNAIDAAMAEELRLTINHIAENAPAFRGLLITGAGRGFCAGGNVGMMQQADNHADTADQNPQGITLGTHHHHVMKILRTLPFPIVTAVNGPAAGLGFSYALMGDIILAARSAFFVASFNRLGVSPDGGLSWTLPRLVGAARAREILLMGPRLSAEQALQWGLINRVFDDENFHAQSEEVAQKLAQGPTLALGITRQLASDSWDNDFADHLDREEEVQMATFASKDAREGAKALMEKREPQFKGE